MTIWDEGFKARIAGKKFSDSPYSSEEPTARQAWREGWHDADEHQCAKAKCFPNW